MPSDPYSLDDLFEGDNTSFLQKKTEETPKVSKSPTTDDGDPLVLTTLEQLPDLDEEAAARKEQKEKRKYEQEETAFIRKEIKEAEAELRKVYSYKDITPRLLYSMLRFYQEEALKGKVQGLLCTNHPQVLLIPFIENDGEREIVVLKAPVVGSLERHQVLATSEIVEAVKDYYRLHNS